MFTVPYAVGDLKNTKLYSKEEEDGLDFPEYTPGSEYRMPIMVQINIRTDKNLDAEYRDNELEFAGSVMDIDLSDSSLAVSDAEIYRVNDYAKPVCRPLGLDSLSAAVYRKLPNQPSPLGSASWTLKVNRLGIKPVLFTVQTDSWMNWGIEYGEIDCCFAFFVYKSVEYVYMGGVSHDMMKVFLNTWSYSF